MILFGTVHLLLSLSVWLLAIRNSYNPCVHWFTGIKVIISVLVLIYGIIEV